MFNRRKIYGKSYEAINITSRNNETMKINIFLGF